MSYPQGASRKALYQKTKTPCVGICSTGIGDSVCRGCNRFDYEVIHWNGYSESEKAAIDSRLSRLLAEVMAKRFVVVDEKLLATQLQLQQVRYAEYRDALCWLHALLRAGATQIKQPEQYGFEPRSETLGMSLPALLNRVDREYYALSVAHFERYIVANSRRASCVSSEAYDESPLLENP